MSSYTILTPQGYQLCCLPPGQAWLVGYTRFLWIAYLYINSLISGIRELRGPSKIGRYGLPRQHSDVGLWLFPNRLIILVYVRFDLLLVFPPAFIKVRPQSVGCVTIYTYLCDVFVSGTT